MIRVQGGTFTMGATTEQGSDACDVEMPVHQVTLSTYYFSETEVTQELWNAVMRTKPSRFNNGSLQRPVERVSWEDCQEFIQRLNKLIGCIFRLPTEAEWEYAARGGNKSRGYKYAGINDISAVAWYTVNAYDKGKSNPDYGTHVVKTKQPNELGIYDMAGNVYEWCQDWYEKYSAGAQSNPKGPSSGSYRVIRGGSWLYDARNFRTSFRDDYASPDHGSDGIGLRLVLVP